MAGPWSDVSSCIAFSALHTLTLTMCSLDSTLEKTRHDPAAQENSIEAQRVSHKPDYATANLIAAYWLAWLTTVASDILIGVRKQFWPGQLLIESPIIRYIYMQHIDRWPAGGFYTVSNHVC